jgi:leucyl/phenylalanyl-tRNA---protein transferase
MRFTASLMGRSRIARGIRRLRRHSQTKRRVCSLLLSTAARDRRSRPYWGRLDPSVRGPLKQLRDRDPARTVVGRARVALPRWQDADVESPFGSPEQWRRDDLIGVSRVFNEELALAAYQSGVFPMPTRPGLMGWYSPLERAILPLDGLRISRSLRKSVRRYEIRIDTAFDDVLDGCADRRRPSGWINREIRRVYRRLHKRGVVHSVEAWTSEGELAGGLYGVSIGGLFAGESMFYRPGIGRDASKVTLVALVDVLQRAGAEGRLLDVQWQTPHLASLGAVALPREEYLQLLEVALRLPPPDWSGRSIP